VSTVRRIASFAELSHDVADMLGSIRYATMTTVDRRGRPRSRVLIAVWELDGDAPVGWLATFKSPVKVAHLAHNPYVTLSYWSPSQDTVSFDATAAWVDDPDVRHRTWDLYRRGSPPRVGYDPLPSGREAPTTPGSMCCDSIAGACRCCTVGNSPRASPRGSGNQTSPSSRPSMGDLGGAGSERASRARRQTRSLGSARIDGPGYAGR